MTRRPYKHKLLLDENFPPRKRLPKLNQLYDVKHVAYDLNKEGLDDPEVYELARKLNRLLVTFNFPHFQNLPTPQDTAGVIGVSDNLPTDLAFKSLTPACTERGRYDPIAYTLFGRFLCGSWAKQS